MWLASVVLCCVQNCLLLSRLWLSVLIAYCLRCLSFTSIPSWTSTFSSITTFILFYYLLLKLQHVATFRSLRHGRSRSRWLLFRTLLVHLLWICWELLDQMPNTTIRQFYLLDFLVLICVNLTVLIKHAFCLTVNLLHWILLGVEIWSLVWILLLLFDQLSGFLMDKGLIGPMLHLVVFVLRILVWFPWVLSVMLLPPLVEHC